MDNTLASKLLIIIDNQRVLMTNQHTLMNILKSIESRLDLIEKAIVQKPTEIVDNEEDEIILFKPSKN